MYNVIYLDVFVVLGHTYEYICCVNVFSIYQFKMLFYVHVIVIKPCKYPYYALRILLAAEMKKPAKNQQ